MKEVPPEVIASGPEGTQWYGGAVDRMKMSLRVSSTGDERDEVASLLACNPDDRKRHWTIRAEVSLDGDFDAQLTALLARCTSDLNTWKIVTSRWKADLFCGLFLERPNRGIEISVESLQMLAERGIELGFDIYAPEDEADN
jgi:hypothetical protein